MLKGRHVRIAPDGDKAGSDMLDHWGALLTRAGCTVDVVVMPKGKDLTDIKNEIQPQEFFAL
jgi:DNA primase